MKRDYTIEMFKYIIKTIRKKYPLMTIATDIIVGHPDETSVDFQKTLDIVKEIEFDVVNISRFWSRPGTLASKKKQLNSKIVKERSLILNKLFSEISLKRNNAWKNWQGTVYAYEKGKIDGTIVARNDYYKPVIIKSDKCGVKKNVKIKAITEFHLKG